jgi:hypothetical protein
MWSDLRNALTVRRTLFILVAGIVAVCAINTLRLGAQAQTADTKPPAFEVASVKPNKSASRPVGGSGFMPGTLPIYRLALAGRGGRLGPQLQRGSVDCVAAHTNGDQPRLTERTPCGMRLAGDTMVATSIPMSLFALTLSVDVLMIDHVEHPTEN